MSAPTEALRKSVYIKSGSGLQRERDLPTYLFLRQSIALDLIIAFNTTNSPAISNRDREKPHGN